MAVFRPSKYFSIISSIQGVMNLSQESTPTEDIVTWNTDNTSRYEGVSLNLTLLATSSLGGTVTYSIIGGNDQDKFQISGGNSLNFSITTDYENPTDANGDNIYVVTLRASSTAGGTSDKVLNIEVFDNAPIWTTYPWLSVIEATNLNLTLEAHASIDNSAVTSFSIVGSIDDSIFSISDGVLNFASGNPAPSYTSPADADSNGVYEVTVRATKYGESTDRTFYITVLQFDTVSIDFTVGLLAEAPDTSTFRMYNSVYNVADDFVFDGLDYGIITVSGVGNLTSTALLDISVNGGSGNINFDDVTGLTSDGDYPNYSSRVKFTGTYSALNNALSNLIIDNTVTDIIVSVDNGYDSFGLGIGLENYNHSVESQLITFDNEPIAGTWDIGKSDVGGEYITLNYNDDATTVQNNLRSNTPFSNLWGANLIVTGDYNVGFSITASKYGNLDNIYTNNNNLKYNTSIAGYASSVYSAAGWNNTSNAIGAPNNIKASESIPQSQNGSKLQLQWNTLPTFSAVVPDGLILSLFVGGNVRDGEISFYNIGGSIGDNKGDTTIWAVANTPKVYGGQSDLWNITKSASEWQTYINGNVIVGITAYNIDMEYYTTAEIDAAYLEIFFTDNVTITQSTLIQGYSG